MNNEIFSSEVLPKNYDDFRKDRDESVREFMNQK